MAKKIQLTIPKPCHEDWDLMSPQDKGRFCGSCQKQVVDFSTMSDRQVAEFFRKPSTGSVCGRFMNDQLDRSLEIPKKRIPWLKYFFTVALPAFFVSLKASGQKTQGTPSVIVLDKDTTRPSIYDDIRIMGMVARPPKIQPVEDVRGEKGRVVDAITGKALPEAQVFMFSTIGKETIKVATDGSFVLNIYRKITVKRIEISMPGYITQKLKLADFMKVANAKQPIKLERVEMIVGDTVMTKIDLPVAEDTIPVCTKLPSLLPTTNFIKGEISSIRIIEKDTAAPWLNNSEPLVGVVGGLTIQRVDERVVWGTIVNEANEPIPFASIVTPDKKTIYADVNGYFEITGKTLKKLKQLLVAADGYNIMEYKIGQSKDFEGERIQLSKKEGEMLVSIHRIWVYPNPVPAGTSLNIEWKQTEEGYYQLELLNQSGQSVHQKEIWVDAEARVLNFELPKVSAGSYFLVLTNKKSGKKFTEKIIVL